MTSANADSGSPYAVGMPEIRLLRYFAAVAEELNFTRAAGKLFIAQPSLSGAVRQLEQQLGVKLFDRDTRSVSLTSAGEALLPYALDAITAVERGVRAARDAEAPTLEVLHILYTPPLEPLAFDALDRLEASSDGMPTFARAAWADELLRELRAGNADAGILRFPGSDTSGLSLVECGGDPACALVAEDHPFASQASVSIAELASAPILVWAEELGFHEYNSFVRELFLSAGERLLVASTRRLDVPGWRPVTRGQALGVVGSTERAPAGTVLVPIDGAPPFPVLLMHAERLTPVRVDQLRAAVNACLRNGPPFRGPHESMRP